MRQIWSTNYNIQQKDLADKYNISKSYVTNILLNKYWKSDNYVPPKNRPVKKFSIRKLSDEDIVKILELYKQNKSYEDIAKIFNCSYSYIGQLCRAGK